MNDSFHALYHHPAFSNLLLCVLATWPLWRGLRRTGQHGGWALLVWLNLLMPGLGVAALTAVLCHGGWPHLPAAAPRWVKTSIWQPKL
jgi:hypothetical protein